MIFHNFEILCIFLRFIENLRITQEMFFCLICLIFFKNSQFAKLGTFQQNVTLLTVWSK